MNLKTSYHYTYFIYPFLITEDKYKDYIKKLMMDDAKWQLNIGEDAIDLSTHAYFLPYVKKFLFPTLYWKNDFRNLFEKMSFKKKCGTISNLSSVNFSYKMKKSFVTNYNSNKTDINFRIPGIELICFEPGICFLIIRAELDKDDAVYSNEILDFNYKFRTINPRYLKKKKLEGMFLENQEFNGLEDLSGFIDGLLNGYEDVEKENIYFDRLFTYSYMCLDENEWNEDRELNKIINEFYKFQYVLPSEYGSTFDVDFKGIKDNTYTRWRYSIYGFSRESGVVFSSGREKFNTTKLPNYYQSMYFYVFLLAFYQRIALILFSQELMANSNNKIESLKKRFTKFTHFSWFSQITNSEQGMDIWKKWQKSFDLPELFDEVQKEYAEFYDYFVARGQEKINILLIIIYTVSVLFSGMTLLYDYDILGSDVWYAKILIEGLLGVTILSYPAYAILRALGNQIKKKHHY